MSKAYALLLTNYAPMIEELKSLRPLVLRVQFLEQALQEEKNDKREWRDYARKLVAQLTNAGMVPEPFLHMPNDPDTDDLSKSLRKKSGDSKARDK